MAERHVAELARSIAATSGRIEGDIPPSRNPIACARLKALGISFGGETLLKATVDQIIQAVPK